MAENDDVNRIPTKEERAESRRNMLRACLKYTDLPEGIDETLAEQNKLQRSHKRQGTGKRKRRRNDHDVEYPQCKTSCTEVEGATEVEEVNPYAEQIRTIAKSTPEVRFTKEQFHRPFNDDELKIIAAGLRTRTALYKIGDLLHCSYTKIMSAIEDIPILKELAMDRKLRECEETEEAIDDCIKQRVPAVVMWKAEKIMPEKYGNQVNIDNEDDTKLVIGALPESEVAEAEELVKSLSDTVPDVEVGAVMESMEAERAAENTAAGSGVPTVPLAQVPPAPAVSPQQGDQRFTQFIPASNMARVPPGLSPDTGGDMFSGVFDDGFGGDDGWS